MTWQTAVTSALGVLSIGAVNLLVRLFAGAIFFVALRSRQMRFTQWPALLRIADTLCGSAAGFLLAAEKHR